MDDRVTVWSCVKCAARIRADAPMFEQGGRTPRHRGTCGGALTWRGDFAPAPAPTLDGDPSRRPTAAEARRARKRDGAAATLNERRVTKPLRHLPFAGQLDHVHQQLVDERRALYQRKVALRHQPFTATAFVSLLDPEPPILSTDERIALQARDEPAPTPDAFPPSWSFRR